MTDYTRFFGVPFRGVHGVVLPFMRGGRVIALESGRKRYILFPERVLIGGTRGIGERRGCYMGSFECVNAPGCGRVHLSCPICIGVRLVVGYCASYYCYCTGHGTFNGGYVPARGILSFVRRYCSGNILRVSVGKKRILLRPKVFSVLGGLVRYRCSPLVSAGVPVNGGMVGELGDVNVRQVRVSLSSIGGRALRTVLRISVGCLRQVGRALSGLRRTGVEAGVGMIVAECGYSYSGLRRLFSFVTRCSGVERVEMGPYNCSLCGGGFRRLSMGRGSFGILRTFVGDVGRGCPGLGVGVSKCSTSCVCSTLFHGRRFYSETLYAKGIHGMILLPAKSVAVYRRLCDLPRFILKGVGSTSLQSV